MEFWRARPLMLWGSRRLHEGCVDLLWQGHPDSSRDQLPVRDFEASRWLHLQQSLRAVEPATSFLTFETERILGLLSIKLCDIYLS